MVHGFNCIARDDDEVCHGLSSLHKFSFAKQTLHILLLNSLLLLLNLTSSCKMYVMLTQKLACPAELAGVVKPGPAGPVLNAPRFGDQVMSKMLHV